MVSSQQRVAGLTKDRTRRQQPTRSMCQGGKGLSPHPALHPLTLQKNHSWSTARDNCVNSQQCSFSEYCHLLCWPRNSLFQAHLANAINFFSIKLSFPNCPYGHPGRGRKGQNEKAINGTSLVAQWLRIRLLRQGTRVWALVWEDPTCCGATKPMCHNYWVRAPRARAPQQK